MTQRVSKAKIEGQKLIDDKITLSPQNSWKICIYIFFNNIYTPFISFKFLKFVLGLHVKIEKWEYFFPIIYKLVLTLWVFSITASFQQSGSLSFGVTFGPWSHILVSWDRTSS